MYSRARYYDKRLFDIYIYGAESFFFIFYIYTACKRKGSVEPTVYYKTAVCFEFQTFVSERDCGGNGFNAESGRVVMSSAYSETVFFRVAAYSE